MCGSRPLRFGSISGAAIAALLLLPNLLAAQEVTEPALKAAFIYNFAKFTEWPSNVMPAAEPFIMCVSGDAPVADALEGAIRGRLLDGHKIIVVREPPIGDRRVCHVLYASTLSAEQIKQLVASLRDAPVLTISDTDGFAKAGGIAQFFFARGRLNFSVQVDAAKRARLQISSRLLALATTK